MTKAAAIAALLIVATACKRGPAPPVQPTNPVATVEESPGFSSEELEQMGVRLPEREIITPSSLASISHKATNRLRLDLGTLKRDEQSLLTAARAVSEGDAAEEIAGIVRELPSPIVLSGLIVPPTSVEQEYQGGVVTRSPDGKQISWRIGFQSDGADAVRLHLRGVTLPSGTRVFVSDGREQVHGPYFTTTDQDRNDFWTHEIGGETIYLEVLVPADANLPTLGLTIDELGHMRDEASDEDDATDAAQPMPFAPTMMDARDRALAAAPRKSPYVDVACMSSADLDPIRDALNADAHISYHKAPKSKFFGKCSAALLSDKRPNGKPTGTLYLLTAHHCVSTSYRAKHLTAYWKYRRATCGGTAPKKSQLEQNLGAQLLKTRDENDFSFILLKGAAPKNAYWFGWSSNPAPIGTILHRIHHPKSYPQKYQKSEIDNRRECSSLLQKEFHYSKRIRGSTWGGSSGSVVFSVRSPAVPGRKKLQAQGQLYGWCNSRNVDGEFNRTYPYIKQWLLPSQ